VSISKQKAAIRYGRRNLRTW